MWTVSSKNCRVYAPRFSPAREVVDGRTQASICHPGPWRHPGEPFWSHRLGGSLAAVCLVLRTHLGGSYPLSCPGWLVASLQASQESRHGGRSILSACSFSWGPSCASTFDAWFSCTHVGDGTTIGGLALSFQIGKGRGWMR